MNPDQLNNEKFVVCNHCGHDANPPTAKRCVKCGKPLNVTVLQNSNKVANSGPKTLADWLLTPWMIRLLSGLVFLIVSWLIYCLFVTVSSVNKTDEIGVANSSGDTQNTSPDVKLYNSMKEVPNVPEGTFNYGGAILFASLTSQGLNEAIGAGHPNFRLLYTQPRDGKAGNKKATTMLLNGQLSFAQLSGPLKESDYSEAKQRGFGLKQVPVGITVPVVFTHPSISIPGLSVTQLQDIYTGKITNWKQVGGPDRPIVPFARDPKISTALDDILGESQTGQISPKLQLVRDYTEAIRKVSSTPGGISFGGSGPILGQQTIRPLAIAKGGSQEYVSPFTDDGKRINTAAVQNGTYPIVQRLFIAIRQDGTIDELAGNAYAGMLLSKEGQQIVEKAGFVPVR
ncbi:hypothetical protein BZZ01_03700 [Nostocales cyanobacterium HT-58-2]|nr:hypothetical protein BZZ01_03700 [Nostocales cyanobacterium HT-58-2]